MGATGRYLSDVAQVDGHLGDDLGLLGGRLELRRRHLRVVLGVLRESPSAGGPLIERLPRSTARTRLLNTHLLLLQNGLNLFDIILRLRLLVITT